MRNLRWVWALALPLAAPAFGDETKTATGASEVALAPATLERLAEMTAWLPGGTDVRAAPPPEPSRLVDWLLPKPRSEEPTNASSVSDENARAALPPAAIWWAPQPFQIRFAFDKTGG